MHTKHDVSSPWFTVSVGLLTFIVGFGLSMGVGANMGWSAPATGGSAAPAPAAKAAPAPAAAADTGTPATADDDMVLGQANAPVTIIEFSDFQCPFCRKFWKTTYPSLKKDYIDTGKAKLVYRDFPLSFHPGAKPAALAVECAHDQSDALAFAFHDKVFEKQDKGGGTVQYTNDDIKTWAAEVTGLNVATWTACFDAGKHNDEIDADMKDGSASGITGTPGFWVIGPNGNKKLKGAQPLAAFQAAIDEVSAK